MLWRRIRRPSFTSSSEFAKAGGRGRVAGPWARNYSGKVIEMSLAGVRVELPSNQPIVLLKEEGGERFLPIWIGAAEAAAIAFALQGVVTPRPMTHDLMKDVLEESGVGLEKISITELREGTFYAVMHLTRDGASFEVSSRPSDAIALAVRWDCPIFADDEVLSEASIIIPADEDEEVEKFREFLDQVTPEDFA
jgi:bifunctional DNase/RNase